MTIVIVCGYGKNWYRLQKYVQHALEIASKAKVKLVIFSGGDTTSDSTSGPWELETEAEVMKAIARIEIATTGKRMKILLEKRAYNTLSNLENSKQMINKNEKIIIICNEAHLLKVKFAAIKVFGLGALRQQISFYPFLLTTGKMENLKILVKTIPETIGYFFPPLGMCISYLQYRQRTGRKEQIGFWKGFWQFRRKFQTGELI